jgi:pimeloyl-ACP methyl ester carboxylesterase
VLLAPAIDLEWETLPGVGAGGIDRWRRDGQIEVFHYAHDRRYPLKYSFYEDAIQYHPEAVRLALPVLIFQGRRDESVDPRSVERFAQAQPDATLHLVDDGHQLKDSLDLIWAETARALGLACPP